VPHGAVDSCEHEAHSTMENCNFGRDGVLTDSFSLNGDPTAIP
jgi:hypothetical protein